MTRAAVHVTTLTANTAVADPTGTTADPATDHVLTPPAGVALEEMFLRIKQTDGSARVATILAGANPPADAAGLGDLTKSMAQNEVWWVGPLTSARFVQADGTVNIDLAASFAGTIEGFVLPRNA